MDAPFTALDVIVFVIVLLSGILAMLRGFTREILSILSWVVALGAAVFAYLNADLRGQMRGRGARSRRSLAGRCLVA